MTDVPQPAGADAAVPAEVGTADSPRLDLSESQLRGTAEWPSVGA